MSSNIRYIDLFAGCGGFSLGLEKSKGYENVGFVEFWQPAIDTFKSNFPNCELLGEDITKIEHSQILDFKKLNVDLIIGGPPCQGFSIAGKRDPKDPRNSLFNNFVHFVEIIKPKAFIMENVKGLVSMKTNSGQKVLDLILNEFQKIGYDVKYKVINAANYGVPQFRERIFFIGFKGKNNFEFPLETHSEKEIIRVDGIKINKFRTVRDVISDLESLESGEYSKKDKLHFAIEHVDRHISWLKETPEGMSAHSNKNPLLRPPSGYPTTYKRFWWDKPAPAVTTCFSSISSQNNVHPRDTRAITIREAARLQTFPDDFKFENSISSIRKQIGNAVPPLLAKVLADELKKHF